MHGQIILKTFMKQSGTCDSRFLRTLGALTCMGKSRAQYRVHQDLGSVALSPCPQNCAFLVTLHSALAVCGSPVKYWNLKMIYKNQIKATQTDPCNPDSVTHLHFNAFTPE